MEAEWSILEKIVQTCLCNSIVREIVMVFGFSWLARKVMNKFGHDISGKFLSRWRLLKKCQLISHVVACTLAKFRMCMHALFSE
jgi:hypothetical protein